MAGGKALTLEHFAEKGMKIEPRAEVKPTVQHLDLDLNQEPDSRQRAKSSIGTRRAGRSACGVVPVSQRHRTRTPDITGFDHLAFTRGGGGAAASIQPHAGMRSVRTARAQKGVPGSMNLIQLKANNDAVAAVWGPSMQHYRPSRSLEGGALLNR